MTMRPGDLVTKEDVDPYLHRRTIERSVRGAATACVLVNHDKPHAWAIVMYQVTGWHCLATGEMPEAKDADAVVDAVTEHFGTGRDYLPRDRFAVRGASSLDVHVRRTTGDPVVYCGAITNNIYEHRRGAYFQYCTECTRTYRSEHYGRHPFEEH